MTRVRLPHSWSGSVALLAVLVPMLRGAPHQNARPGDENVVRVAIDATREHQRIEGFGATHRPGVHGRTDLLGEELRRKTLEALYQKVRLTTGNLDAALHERSGGDGDRRNDNDKPEAVDWSHFQTDLVDAMKALVVDRPEAAGFNRFFIAQKINTRWGSPWLAAMRQDNYRRYVAEAVEQIVAAQLYWRDKHGIVPRYHQIFNEPLSGNTELHGAAREDLADIVRSAGRRLRKLGFADVLFVVPNEVNLENSIASAEVILADKGARSFVGALGYHAYGDPFGESGRALVQANKGETDSRGIEARDRLRNLARKYGLPVWMTETSGGGEPGFSYESFRARAVHIHHELAYADASVYMAMNSFWDLTSHQEHFRKRDGFDGTEGDVVLVDQEKKTVTITGIGYAIGHYARWLTPGATVRVDASSGDRFVMATAFRDDEAHRLVTVVLNNAAEERTIQFDIDGAQTTPPAAAEQSTVHAYWSPLRTDGIEPGLLRLVLPARSVTTLALPLAGSGTAGH